MSDRTDDPRTSRLASSGEEQLRPRDADAEPDVEGHVMSGGFGDRRGGRARGGGVLTPPGAADETAGDESR